MEHIEADLVVIGSGPAGQKAAIQGAKLGKRVVVVEKDDFPGGSNLNYGTIPSKSLREAILDLTRFHERSFYGKDLKVQEVSIYDLNFRLRQVIDEELKLVLRQFQKNRIRLIKGTASFESSNRISVTDPAYDLYYEIKTEFALIATGSRPRNPTHVPFDDRVILDSTRLLSIDKVPKSMVVLGGGIIGSEYASFFSALGARVIVVDKRSHILPQLDSEIGIHLQSSLADLDMEFLGNRKVVEIKRVEDHAIVYFEDGSTLEADVLLYALGRVADVEALNIEKAGIALNERGYIPVNALFHTSTPNIYAVGDVIGGPSLASTSMEQGRLAIRHAFGAEQGHFPALYPIGIYTIPEISCVGRTEDELEKKGIHYEVGRAYYYEIARGHISGSNIGMFKILFHAETLEILGIHIIGRSATELIHIGQVAMTFNAHIDYFVNQIFNYPTFAEGYRIAALNGINKIKNLL